MLTWYGSTCRRRPCPSAGPQQARARATYLPRLEEMLIAGPLRGQRRRSRGVGHQKRQHGIAEFPRPDVHQEVSAAREKLDLGGRDQPRQLFGKICRGDDVVLGPYY